MPGNLSSLVSYSPPDRCRDFLRRLGEVRGWSSCMWKMDTPFTKIGGQLTTGHCSINPFSHVFNAEAIGARTNQKMPPEIINRGIWMCIDRHQLSGVSVVMQEYDVGISWAPGHTGMEGNEAAEKLVDLRAKCTSCDTGLAAEPTISRIRSIMRKQQRAAHAS
ncbi:hypothetical protein EAF04_003602 [Stromatinia cepivora]|nr:hypothetical protein EAF04_003602 [Stromatinia cepivora]